MKTYKMYVFEGNKIMRLDDVLETADVRLMREWARQRLGQYRLVMVFDNEGTLVFQACK